MENLLYTLLINRFCNLMKINFMAIGKVLNHVVTNVLLTIVR